MAAAARPPTVFDPAAHDTFRFLERSLEADGRVRLGYALSDIRFEETIELPALAGASVPDGGAVQGALSLLHWIAGVSYFKAALPQAVEFAGERPGPAAAALLEALYSEGLGELAYANRVPLPRPDFRPAPAAPAAPVAAVTEAEPRTVLVPVGGGKDSIVALEIVRRAGLDVTLFSIGDPVPIARTVAVAGLPRLLARRSLDPRLLELNGAGAINGHVPVTAIVSAVALLTAALHGFDAVAMANERSASSPNLEWDGTAVNHQFSKSLRVERLLRGAAREAGLTVGYFSLLRPASELAIARAFARLEPYRGAFTSCNRVFRLDPALRASSWCCDCPKCRFVYLALAPFLAPERLVAIFGRDLLADDSQTEGFALLTATGGPKPFECVGEEEESLAAIRLLTADPRWREHTVVRRLAAEVLPVHAPAEGDPAGALALSREHDVPASLMAEVNALLGA